MLKTDELIDEAMSLPVELRAQLVNKLLKSLNPAQAEIDELWAIEAEKRVAEIEAGKVQPVPGDEVFGIIRKRDMKDSFWKKIDYARGWFALKAKHSGLCLTAFGDKQRKITGLRQYKCKGAKAVRQLFKMNR